LPAPHLVHALYEGELVHEVKVDGVLRSLFVECIDDQARKQLLRVASLLELTACISYYISMKDVFVPSGMLEKLDLCIVKSEDAIAGVFPPDSAVVPVCHALVLALDQIRRDALYCVLCHFRL
jgi:hypothetical protein